MFKIKIFFARFALLCLISPAFANHANTITNNSNAPWVISFNPSHGNARFILRTDQYCEESHIKNGPCTVLPGDVVKISYSTTGGISDGHIRLTDQYNNMVSYFYYGNWSRELYITVPDVYKETLSEEEAHITIHQPNFPKSPHENTITNLSPNPWIISFEGDHGDAYFKLRSDQYCEESHIKNGPCLLLPGDVMNIGYSTTNQKSNGEIVLTDIYNSSWSYGYYGDFSEELYVKVPSSHKDILQESSADITITGERFPI